MFELRDYQQKAVDSAFSELKKTTKPIVLELATGAGKSIIIAELAKMLFSISKKRILCLAPSKELIEQNYSKYIAYGYSASIFCASAGVKCINNPVVFGSPLSVINSIELFKTEFSAIIIDECHKITSAIKDIINEIRDINPNLRVIGLTATPYRLGTGYIYEINEENKSEESAKNPFFKKLVYKLRANELIGLGFLTEPTTEIKQGYDTSSLELAKTGKFTQESLNKAFVGKGRLTSNIVNEVVSLTSDRKSVMFFASTIEHANEILDSLPKNNSRLITGQTSKAEREIIINDFKDMKFKYIINVAVLTTGFDAPAVDCIAILRPTESASLFQQIIGRGLRLYPDKKDCLILDYAENIERHNLKDDIFNPEIIVYKDSKVKKLDCICASCGANNTFSARLNPDKLKFDENGYFIDLEGNRIIDADSGLPFPAHFGRRCKMVFLQAGEYQRCIGRWSFKKCPECEAENDIASRKCTECKAELVDPNKKLVLKSGNSEKIIETSKVIAVNLSIWNGRSQKESLKVDFTIEGNRIISVWLFPNNKYRQNKNEFKNFCKVVTGRKTFKLEDLVEWSKTSKFIKPETICYYRDKGYYRIVSYNNDKSLRKTKKW